MFEFVLAGSGGGFKIQFVRLLSAKDICFFHIHTYHVVMEGRIISSVTPPNCSLLQEAAVGNRGRERLTLSRNRMEKRDRWSHSHLDTLYKARL